MTQYSTLIETLRDDFMSRQRYYGLGGDHNYLLPSVVPGFEIVSEQDDFAKKKQIIEYKIAESASDKNWDIIVGPAVMLFGRQFDRFRERLIKENSVLGVFTTKNGFFKDTLYAAAVIVLGERRNRTWFSSVASNDDIVTLLKSPKKYNRKVYYAEILDTNNFMPEHYNSEITELNAVLDEQETKILDDIAEIISGASIPSTSWCEEGIPYVRGRDIQNGQLKKSEVFVPFDSANQYSKKLLQEGDILLSKNYGQHKVALVSNNDLPAIASNGLFIIRPYGVPDGFLYRYLTSETGKKRFDKQLKSIEKGVTVSSINLKDLSQIRVPVFKESDMQITLSNDLRYIIELNQGKRLLRYVEYCLRIANIYAAKEFKNNTSELFRKVGWDESEIVFADKQKNSIQLEGAKWCPDIILLDEKKDFVYLASREAFTQFSVDELIVIDKVIKSGIIPFVILRIGSYFEIHSANNRIIKKQDTAPTKKYLISLLDGKEVQ